MAENRLGNIILSYLARLVGKWTCYANIDTAKGFYKAVIKIETTTKVLFWAFEWNKSFRICGFIGDEISIDPIIKKIPKENWSIIHQEGEKIIRTKTEIPYSKETDNLFIGEIEE